MSTVHASVSAGFADPVHDAQAAFRGVLDALARPGRPQAVGAPIKGLALGPAMSHLLLALADDDTPVWWQQPQVELAAWLRFHTGAPAASKPSDAVFSVITDAGTVPALNTFAAGSVQSPEQCATLLVEVSSLCAGPAALWRGPGIATTETVRIAGLPDHFWAQWRLNHAAFPQGVDIVFTCADRALGLPRTTQVQAVEAR